MGVSGKCFLRYSDLWSQLQPQLVALCLAPRPLSASVSRRSPPNDPGPDGHRVLQLTGPVVFPCVLCSPSHSLPQEDPTRRPGRSPGPLGPRGQGGGKAASVPHPRVSGQRQLTGFSGWSLCNCPLVLEGAGGALRAWRRGSPERPRRVPEPPAPRRGHMTVNPKRT